VLSLPRYGGGPHPAQPAASSLLFQLFNLPGAVQDLEVYRCLLLLLPAIMGRAPCSRSGPRPIGSIVPGSGRRRRTPWRSSSTGTGWQIGRLQRITIPGAAVPVYAVDQRDEGFSIAVRRECVEETFSGSPDRIRDPRHSSSPRSFRASSSRATLLLWAPTLATGRQGAETVVAVVAEHQGLRANPVQDGVVDAQAFPAHRVSMPVR